MTWRDEAKGLPVWEGALFYDDDSGFKRVCTSVDTQYVYFNGDECMSRASVCTPALDNPDTFAAFLRRLAIRLGCPEEVAAGGVAFSRRGPFAWVVYAGWNPASWGWAWAVGVTFGDDKMTDDRLLAAVQAWKGVDVL